MGQALTQIEGKRQAAVIVEQAAHAHTALGRQHQRLHDGFGTGAGLDQIQLKFDLLLRASNLLKHAREELRAVDQQLEPVAVTPREHRAAHVSAP